MCGILNHEIQTVSETRLIRSTNDVSAFSLAMRQGFVLSLYKRDTAIPPVWLGGQLTPLQYALLSSLSNKIYIPTLPTSYLSPTYTYTACIPQHIPTQSTSRLSPTYTYTAYIPFIPPHIPTPPESHFPPQIYLDSLHLIPPPTYTYSACMSFFPHIYLHSLHVISLPQIPTQPTSHLSPRYTYTACISSPPHI